MSELEEKKAEIAFLEKLFFVGLAAMFAVVGWLATSYQTAEVWLLAVAGFSVLASAVVVLRVYRKIKVCIRELRDL